jgi:hypothetical protein
MVVHGTGAASSRSENMAEVVSYFGAEWVSVHFF